MELRVLPQVFSICKISDLAHIDLSLPFIFFAKTDEELSLVCETDLAPAHFLAREDGWRGFRIQGVLDFSMVGVLAKISSLLAEREISIFAVSTYDTDYFFTKAETFERAKGALAEDGFTLNDAILIS